MKPFFLSLALVVVVTAAFGSLGAKSVKQPKSEAAKARAERIKAMLSFTPSPTPAAPMPTATRTPNP